MSFLKGLPGTRTVTLIKGEGTGAEQRLEIEGQIQAQKGFFSLQVPIQEGDVIEEPDPRPGMSAIRRTAGRVELAPRNRPHPLGSSRCGPSSWSAGRSSRRVAVHESATSRRSLTNR